MKCSIAILVAMLLISPTAQAAEPVPTAITAAIADAARPDADKARDPNRKPA